MQKHSHGRRLNVLSAVDDLLKTGYTQCDILTRHTRVVERVKSHLSRWLTDTLRSECSAHLARLRQTASKLALDFTKNPLPRLARKVVYFNHLFRAQVRTQVDLEEQRCVLLHRATDRVVPTHDQQVVQCALQPVDDFKWRQVAWLAWINVENLLGVEYETSNVERQVGIHTVRLEDFSAQHAAVLLELLKLFVQQLFQLGRPVAEASAQCALLEATTAQIHTEAAAEFCIAQAMSNQLLALHHSTVNAILTICKFNHIVCRVAHRTIVANCNVLQRLDEAALDITRLSRFDRSINQTFTASHRVEEELMRRQATQVRVLDKPTALWCKVVFRKVRQSAMTEAERNTLTLD